MTGLIIGAMACRISIGLKLREADLSSVRPDFVRRIVSALAEGNRASLNDMWKRLLESLSDDMIGRNNPPPAPSNHHVMSCEQRFCSGHAVIDPSKKSFDVIDRKQRL
jgi:hypothetical protein